MFKLGINKIVINPNFRKINPGDCEKWIEERYNCGRVIASDCK